MTEPVDQPSRERALDPGASFIVQAPAGSGKTGLLVRRYLRLLATVDAPEQILAITFTRKAAAEMRQRIVFALDGLDSDGRKPADGETLELARAAAARDAELGWSLAANPRRLRVQTIDSFCQELVRRMPWSARFGGVPVPMENADQLYQAAADVTLQLVEDRQRPELAGACARLLRLVDANRTLAQTLLADMLDGRDRWMHILRSHDRAQFEGWWQETINDTLRDCHRQMDPGWRQELARSATLAAQQVQRPENNAKSNTLEKLAPWISSVGFPEPDCWQVDHWRGLAFLLLTNDQTVRKRLDRTIGFPPDEKETKQRMSALLEALADDPGQVQAWQRVSILPDPQISDTEWENIDALLTLLPVAAAELRLQFKAEHSADFTEISQRADMALGGGDDPSDLGLALDYQLRHILMDEFQDTSTGQIELLRKLLAGWQPDDGRSLFLVGDPMQSIYRFREAEVGNFMTVQDHGIDDVLPERLNLESNFRSAPELVNWFNQAFPQVMPARRSVVHGAVEYTAASAFRPPDDGAGVTMHAAIRRDHVTEAVEVVDCIARTLEEFPDGEIAVLGRSRGHLAHIVEQLNDRQIPFQGLKLEHLGERQAVQDLLALAGVLAQPADDVAWFGLLRAPWAGATLDELICLVGEGGENPVLAALGDEDRLARLPADSRRRIEKTRNVVTQGLKDRARLPLSRNLEACWLRLGGPAVVETDDLDNCSQLVALVKTMENEGLAIHAESLQTAIADLYAEHHRDERVKLMTIHGAKGLEFDTVVLPGLHRVSMGDSKPLLRWKRLPDRLLIAPRAHSNETSPVYDYLTELEKEQQRNERSRLLYVACTRARRRLHLFGSARPNTKGEVPSPPASSSLLALLWPAMDADFQQALDRWTEPPSPDETTGTTKPSKLVRLDAGWTLPDLPSPVPRAQLEPGRAKEAEAIEFDWARESARIAGIVIHQELQFIDRTGWDAWQGNTFSERDRSRWRRFLGENGLAASQLDEALAHVESALSRVQRDAQAAWIFSARHEDIRTEWALTGIEEGAIRNVVLDRTFRDGDGIRWVLDFKSSRHDDEATLDAFLAAERERYRNTMMRYTTILQALEGSPARAALYYPMLGRLLHYD